VPENTIVATTEAALRGLLEASSGVSDIHYKGGAPAADLVIPSGKTVYADDSSTFTLTKHLAVEQDATLVLVQDLTTATAGKLLVNGTVKVGPNATLAYNTAATEVTDYTVDATTGAPKPGSDTVIGTLAVEVLKYGNLQLATGDVVSTAATGKFTLAEAWDAAGEGYLSINGATAFTVSDLVALATETRGIVAATNDTTALPAVIPANAWITVTGAVKDTTDHTLTVYGHLTLSAATLEEVTEIAVGDGGSFTSASTVLDTKTKLTKITVGKGATFSTTGSASNATYAAVTEITVGAGSTVTVNAAALFTALTSLDVGASATFNAVAATVPTYAALTTLSVGDYATATLAVATSDDVTFATNGLETLTLGKNAKVDAGVSSAVVKGGTDTAVSISKDATVSGIKIMAGTTLTVAANTTLTVSGLLTVDGTLAFTDATSQVVLLAGSSISAAATGVLKANASTADGSGVSLHVAAAGAPGTPTAFTSDDVNAPAVVTLTTASTAAGGAGTAYPLGNASFAVENASTATPAAAVTSIVQNPAAAGIIKAAATSTVVVLKGKAA
jgi:hypothetical protein